MTVMECLAAEVLAAAGVNFKKQLQPYIKCDIIFLVRTVVAVTQTHGGKSRKLWQKKRNILS